ncbi:MAG TPA: alpha-(1-_3)-arabinofuranosyltransferase family protein [Thermoleophilaceae bacterium]
MRAAWRERAFPLGLAAAAYAIALLQRPGEGSFDTKVDLHVDPSGFIGRVADVWSPTAGLGHIQGGQYSGYLWPMGPFFAALRELGLSPWLVQRLWLGTLLALAAWGTVRLLDRLLGRPRGVAHAVAGALVVLNPYVVVFTNRTTFTLIGYAALPWLLLLVHRGVREPRRLWWAAAFALIVTSLGGGVNAAVTAWVLVGPLLLLLYEPLLGGVSWRGAGAFALRAGAATALASVWWVVPALVQASYGLNFLSYTEQIGAIWATTSLSESVRLMGYWPSYLGVGYGDRLEPYFGSSPSLLFDPAVVIASLLVPALAFAGFAWTRRWRYGPFFLALGIAGALIMSVGFPEGTPLREGATFAINHFDAVEFLRTTYKAGPLVALSVACLAGAGAAALARRLASRPPRVAAALGGAALVALAALPMVRGEAVELTYDEVPAAWTQGAAGLDRELRPNTRALMLPGQPFAFHTWGGTVDPILPALTDRPVAVRNVPPYDDLHAVDMLWTVDNLVQQQRLLPGQLAPLLDLMSAGAVVTSTDDDFERSGAMPPAQAARELAGQGLRQPDRSYGPSASFRSPRETIDPPLTLPQLRRYDVAGTRGIVRLLPDRPATVVDGSAAGVAGLASIGGLRRGRPLLYAADLPADELRERAGAGGEVVITDSNRRRVFVASRPRQAYGWTLPAGLGFSEDAATLDPFEGHGADAQTVATYTGARDVSAPFSPQFPQFPEHRPYAAFDGDPATAWQADPTLDEPRHWVEVRFREPRDVPRLDLLPDDSNPNVVVTRVSVNGREHALRPGWNRLAVGLRGVDSVRVTITEQRTVGEAGSAGGFREVRVPGVTVRELLRPPTLAERALRGADLARTPMTYLFERTTADVPFRRGAVPPPAPVGNRAESEAALARAAQDPEPDIRRAFSPPAARRWSTEGWATVTPTAPDPALDTMAGTAAGGSSASSSSRFEGRPGFRASRAFDGDPRTAWVGQWLGRGAWLEWRGRRAVRLSTLRLAPGPAPARRPARVALSYPGGRTPPLTVGRDGTVTLPRAVRAARFRVEVLAAGPGSADAVGIGELSAQGLPRAARRRPGAARRRPGAARRRPGAARRRPGAAGRPPAAATELAGAAVRSRCGDLAAIAGGRRLLLAARGNVADFDAGRPLRVRSCGDPLALPAGPAELRTETGLLRPLLLALRSPAAAPAPRAAASPGEVRSPGRAGRGEHTGVRVDVREPGWLVLGESYNRGWRATCDGRSLGAPRVIDGFANGWRVEPGCRDVAFRFAPQRAVDAGFWVGGAACLLLLALVLLRRPPRRGPDAAPAELAVGDARRPWPARAAALAGLAAGAALGFVFALRAGVVIAPAVFLILWRGWPPRALILGAAGLLVVVVPALYLIVPGRDRGGYDTRFAVEHIAAHWVTVAAVVLLVLALWRTVSTASRASGGRARAPEPERRAPARP